MTNLRSLPDLLRAAMKLAAACVFATLIAPPATGQTNTFQPTGNAGAGTTSPDRKLEVLDSGSPQIRLTHTDGSVYTDLQTTSFGQLLISPTGVDTTSTKPFTVAAGSDAFRFYSNVDTNLRWSLTTDASGLFHVVQKGDDWVSQGARLSINRSGDVGIGTTTPIYSLDVNGGVNGFRAKAATASSSDAIATFENSSGIQAIVRGNGNVGFGITSPAEKLEINGNLKLSGTGNISASGTIEADNIKAKYQDIAEWVASSEQLSAGTVVVLDTTKSNQVVSSSVAYDTRVAGVISAQPGITLGEGGEGKVLVATSGRVRVKVDASRGAIQIGDLLVTCDVAGLAMKSEAVNLGGVQIHRPGTIIGKALEPLTKGSGEILVLLSLQ